MSCRKRMTQMTLDVVWKKHNPQNSKSNYCAESLSNEEISVDHAVSIEGDIDQPGPSNISTCKLSQNDLSDAQMESKVTDSRNYRGTELMDLHTYKIDKNAIADLKAYSKVYDVINHDPVLNKNEILDKWDADHVRLPCSKHNLYPVDGGNGERLVNRWDLIEKALTAPIKSSYDLEEAILSYNRRYASSWNFRGFHKYCNEILSDKERQNLFERSIPNMIHLALTLPALCPKPIPLCKESNNCTVLLSQRQVSCLLANAFFCTFPRRNISKRRDNSAIHEFDNYPCINFNFLFGSGRLNQEKLKFLLYYFRRITENVPKGVISFERRCLRDLPNWSESNIKLSSINVHISADGTIEDFGGDMLQVDFANKYIGGGVLRQGSVQEEIRFLINPELIASMLFMERMQHNEAIIITGVERYSYYAGYGDSLRFAAPFFDSTERDNLGRRMTQIVAIDAIPYHKNPWKQFSPERITRELNKAYVGFYEPAAKRATAVATGNWGCGAFMGNKQLKSLIQLMAACQCKRDLAYFTFGDRDLMLELHDVLSTLTKHNVSIGQLLATLQLYYEFHISESDTSIGGGITPERTVFEFLLDTYS